VIGLPDGVRVYLAAGRTDLRRGIDGLAAQIQTVLREDPFVLPSLHLPGPRGPYDQGFDV
jgi:transposase